MKLMTILSILHKGTFALKMKTVFFIGILTGTFSKMLSSVTEWHLENETYVFFVLTAVAIDHLVGTIFHIKKKDFSLKKNVSGFVFKLIMVVSVGILFEGLNFLLPNSPLIREYAISILRAVVFLYPASSAFGNIYEMTGGKFPPSVVMERLKKVQENL